MWNAVQFRLLSTQHERQVVSLRDLSARPAFHNGSGQLPISRITGYVRSVR
jgi:hypothetical protein